MSIIFIPVQTPKSNLSFPHRATPCSRYVGRLSSSCNPSLVTRTPLRAPLEVIVRVSQDDKGDKNGGKEQAQAAPPSPLSISNMPDRTKLIVGSLTWLALPAWKKLQNISESLDAVDDVVEGIIDLVKKMDEILKNAVKKLPEGSARVWVQQLDNLLELLESKAKNLDDLLHKIKDMARDLTNTLREENKSRDEGKRSEEETADEQNES